MWIATRSLVPGVLLALAGFQSTAQEAAGNLLAAQCFTCHGPAGHGAGAIPPLDGLDATAIVTRLRGFASGEIEATIMDRIARGFTDPQIDAVARYLASLQ